MGDTGYPPRDHPFDPQDEDKADYQSAYQLLIPIFGEATAAKLKAQLEDCPVLRRTAADVVRTTCIQPYPPDDPMVEHFMAKIRRGKTPKPILLVEWRPVILADGHHRTSAAYWVDPEFLLDCKVA